jgi:hypothetical protein
MGIKDMLVIADNTPSNKSRLELATWLLRLVGAVVIAGLGLAAWFLVT